MQWPQPTLLRGTSPPAQSIAFHALHLFTHHVVQPGRQIRKKFTLAHAYARINSLLEGTCHKEFDGDNPPRVTRSTELLTQSVEAGKIDGDFVSDR
jgi:hypothetical protein